ncbi:helix-turn-helix domain-containing protein [Streptomyces sp. Wb2n-11]|uniref:helix-turn-helix domain-containing protein n=1 Tax=Streptomyces sp. Wb2n-11 TaxID=1030533 RepID=UPI000A5591EA
MRGGGSGVRSGGRARGGGGRGGRRRSHRPPHAGAPASTTEPARSLGVTPSAVSQHLPVLPGAGLVTRARAGRVVLHGLSDLGARLAGGDR